MQSVADTIGLQHIRTAAIARTQAMENAAEGREDGHDGEDATAIVLKKVVY